MNIGADVVGIIANPAAGKDIRRLVSAASPVSDMAKIGIIRRAAIGAAEGGASGLLVADDRHALARRALEGLDALGVTFETVEQPLLSTGRDTQRAAAAMAERAVGAVVVLGGDGTHRDVAKGWRQAPMVAVSTGTNNVFPRALEATTAGYAAGLVASGQVALTDDGIAHRAKIIEVTVHRADGTVADDLGLVDIALTSSSFIGSRAVWEVASLRRVLTAIAEPATVGLSSVAAALAPLDRQQPGAVLVEIADDADSACGSVRCPIAPGAYVEVPIAGCRRLEPGEGVTWPGPGAMSFDGERDLVLGPDDRADLRVAADGPYVIDVPQTLLRAANHGQRTRGTHHG